MGYAASQRKRSIFLPQKDTDFDVRAHKIACCACVSCALSIQFGVHDKNAFYDMLELARPLNEELVK